MQVTLSYQHIVHKYLCEKFQLQVVQLIMESSTLGNTYISTQRVLTLGGMPFTCLKCSTLGFGMQSVLVMSINVLTLKINKLQTSNKIWCLLNYTCCPSFSGVGHH